jgi:hypothetical protein
LDYSEENTAANTGLAKVSVQCIADSFVVTESSVLRMKFSGKKPAHRQSLNRQALKKLVLPIEIFGYHSEKFLNIAF